MASPLANHGSRRGHISIDRIVAVRSSVLPLYVLIRPGGIVTTSDEVSEDGDDFLTTRMHGDQISFQSIGGWHLSAEGGEICTRRYCSSSELFYIERYDTQYTFRTSGGKYLCVVERAPFVALADNPGDTEMFQLFSLMMSGVNVGRQLDLLERNGSVMVDGVIGGEFLEMLRADVSKFGGTSVDSKHEVRVQSLAAKSASFARLAMHSLIMQLARRIFTPSPRLSEFESCCTNADFVCKELEQTTWHVVHPYRSVEYPGIADPRANMTATWFLDALDEVNSTWAWAEAPLKDGAHLPLLPHLSSPDDVVTVVKRCTPLRAMQGAVWINLGPAWMSNNVGAAAFWKSYDAQTRYKHLSGQKEQVSFRSLTDSQHLAPAKAELCPSLAQATYVREFVAPRMKPEVDEGTLCELSQDERCMLDSLLRS